MKCTGVTEMRARGWNNFPNNRSKKMDFDSFSCNEFFCELNNWQQPELFLCLWRNYSAGLEVISWYHYIAPSRVFNI